VWISWSNIVSKANTKIRDATGGLFRAKQYNNALLHIEINNNMFVSCLLHANMYRV